MTTQSLERIGSTPLGIDKRGTKLRVVVAADNYTVATINNGMNDREEYARLFAASPRMLAALKRARFVLESPAIAHLVNGAGTLDLVRAAISSAEGEKS